MAQADGQNKYILGYRKGHVRNHEWRTAENSAGFLLPVLKDLHEKSLADPSRTGPSPRLLDIGAGSGTITASLAKYIPHGHITATDISPEILARAAEHATSQGVTNITFQPANIFHLPFPDGTFDVVHVSMVLSHLEATVDAYRELLRVTKPGGVVANREAEACAVTVYPGVPALLKFNKVLEDTLAAAAGSEPPGPPHQLGDAGGGETMAERLRDGPLGRKAVEIGVASEEDVEAMARAWEEWITTEDACYSSMNGEILIRK
ncbi:Methyltransferase domain [Teratosphaeria destructans]|uniref:Methyltransferase domain n=1 Tax=Teratosphaeria destructans TaxID=418781 RepID=A0A9W7W213_9PEZI|nr:Methyltransferase domain [Teratosphaeria destructans]